jgi:hypothetical protein
LGAIIGYRIYDIWYDLHIHTDMIWYDLYIHRHTYMIWYELYIHTYYMIHTWYDLYTYIINLKLNPIQHKPYDIYLAQTAHAMYMDNNNLLVLLKSV